MWGCLFADIVAVPVCPPDPTRLGATLPHFSRIVADSGAVAILTDRSFLMVRVPLPVKLLVQGWMHQYGKCSCLPLSSLSIVYFQGLGLHRPIWHAFRSFCVGVASVALEQQGYCMIP